VESNELFTVSPAASAVERLMRHHGIVGLHKTAKVRTTIPAEDAPPLPDLIGRRFAAGRPDIEQALTPVEPEPAAAEPPAPAPPGLVAKAYPTGPPAPAGGCATNGSGNSSRSDLLRQAPRRR
jgi:transposase InsO family protein